MLGTRIVRHSAARRFCLSIAAQRVHFGGVDRHFSLEPFPLGGRIGSERPGAVKGAPLLGAAKRTLDGEDRSATISQEGKAPTRSVPMAATSRCFRAPVFLAFSRVFLRVFPAVGFCSAVLKPGIHSSRSRARQGIEFRLARKGEAGCPISVPVLNDQRRYRARPPTEPRVAETPRR